MKIKTLLASTLVLVAGVALKAQDKLVPFKTAVPPPQLSCKPVMLKVPHLETQADTEARPLVMVSENSTNLALGKPVRSSDKRPVIGELSQITDGDKKSNEGSYVEFDGGLQWVQIDLEKTHKIYAIALWHFHAHVRVYHDIIVQISNDDKFLTGVTTVFNDDHDNSSGLGAGKDKAYVETNKGRVFPVGDTGIGVSGRYVRFYSRGSTANPANHYIEVEVWGE